MPNICRFFFATCRHLPKLFVLPTPADTCRKGLCHLRGTCRKLLCHLPTLALAGVRPVMVQIREVSEGVRAENFCATCRHLLEESPSSVQRRGRLNSFVCAVGSVGVARRTRARRAPRYLGQGDQGPRRHCTLCVSPLHLFLCLVH